MNLDPRSTKTLYEQIYEYIRDEIRKGTLKCGERLPSTRLLASHLDVSRSTAQLAYEQLLSEGILKPFHVRVILCVRWKHCIDWIQHR